MQGIVVNQYQSPKPIIIWPNMIIPKYMNEWSSMHNMCRFEHFG